MGDASKLILLRTRSQMKRRAAALAQPQYAPLPPCLIPEKLAYMSISGFITLRWGLIAESANVVNLT